MTLLHTNIFEGEVTLSDTVAFQRLLEMILYSQTFSSKFYT
jgi:hypothetical protein